MITKLTVAFTVISCILMFSFTAFANPPDKIVFTPKKGDISFTHKIHSEKHSKKCQECHHTYKDKEAVKKCRDCHFDKKKEKAISLKNAQHKSCKGCHKAFNKKNNAKSAPLKCKECHTKKK